jgi:proline iminopeptidase
VALWDGCDLPARFPEVPCPVFLAQGRYDFACPPALWDGERERFPDATSRLFDRSGHSPQLDEPDAFTAALAAWLARPLGGGRRGAESGSPSERP